MKLTGGEKLYLASVLLNKISKATQLIENAKVNLSRDNLAKTAIARNNLVIEKNELAIKMCESIHSKCEHIHKGE